jgi:thiosulfate/3-mercaptopyruvate sulfurtransferase
VVDARGGADAYDRFQAGHLRGAKFLDLESDLSRKGLDAAQGGRHPLPDPAEFGLLLGRTGILPTTHVLVYDDKAGANAAARFWWMMRAAGHESVQVIDGGLDAIRSAGLPISRGTADPAHAHAQYPVRGWRLPMADMEEVDGARSSGDAVVIDVREGYRYRAEAEPIDKIAGHIPGAINLPYTDNLQQDGRFHSAEFLKQRYAPLTEGKKVIVHCGSGVTACHALLAMAVAGIENAHLYVGSWSEWSRNQKPVATGGKP